MSMMQRMREIEQQVEVGKTRLTSFIGALNYSGNFKIPIPKGHAVRYPLGTDKEGNEWELSIAFPPDCNSSYWTVETMLFKKGPEESEFDGAYVEEWGYHDVKRFDGTITSENVDAVADEIVKLKYRVEGVEVPSEEDVHN